MEFNVDSNIPLVWLHIIVLILSTISVSRSQTVTVSINSTSNSNPATDSATLTCDFSVDDRLYLFFNLEWRKSGVLVADFYNGAEDPAYRNFCLDSGTCNITRSSSKSDFIISSVDMTMNKEAFSCRVIFAKGTDRRNDEGTSLLVVVVPVKTMEMFNGSSPGDVIGNGSDVSIGADGQLLQCVVADINPQATFTWTVGVDQLSGTKDDYVTDSVTGLITSTSNATLAPNLKYSGEFLTCKAVNYEGDPGVIVRLFLKTVEVADQCMDVDCKNGGTCVPDTSDPSDPGKPKCICTKGFTGDFCKEGPTETTSDIGPTSTESPTTINTGTRGSSTTPTGSSEMSTRSSEMTTGSSEMTTGSTEMTNSAYPLTPSTTAHTPETTPTGCTTLCDEEKGLSIGIITGIVVGSLCGVVIIVCIVIAIWKCNSNNGVTPEKEKVEGEHV